MGTVIRVRRLAKEVLAELTLQRAWESERPKNLEVVPALVSIFCRGGFLSGKGKGPRCGIQKTLVDTQPSICVVKQSRDPGAKASRKRIRKWARRKLTPTSSTKQSPTEAGPGQDQGRQVELPGKAPLPRRSLKGEQRAESPGNTLLQTAVQVQQKYHGAFQGGVLLPGLQSWEEKQFKGYI